MNSKIVQYKKVTAWLNEPPRIVNQNNDGSEFVPIGVVEDDLTCLDSHWGTENFKFRVIGDYFAVSSSVELVVTYNGRTRKVVGASTIKMLSDAETPVTIDSAEAISLSESLKNAAKKLGRRFGCELNGRMDYIRGEYTGTGKENADTYSPGYKKPPARSIKNSVLITPDKEIRIKYAKAVAAKDTPTVKELESIYQFQIG